MPKVKTNKSVSKRFRKTASGKFKRHQSKRRHLMVSKNASKKRQMRSAPVVHATDEKRLRILLPYA